MHKNKINVRASRRAAKLALPTAMEGKQTNKLPEDKIKVDKKNN